MAESPPAARGERQSRFRQFLFRTLEWFFDYPPERRLISKASLVHNEEIDMAKGQGRSNREAKKPKKDKPRDTAATGRESSWLTVEKLQARELEAKRRK
jgi:hypothetical protein